MKEKYSNDIDTLHENQQILNIQLRRIQNNGDINNEHIEIFKSYKGIKKLDRRLIVKLIDKIIVDKDKSLEIVFNFQNPLNKYLSYLDK